MKKKITIAVVIYTEINDRFHMVNSLRSLVDLSPEEVCVLDTTRDDEKSSVYRDWIKRFGSSLGLSMKLSRRKWDGSYKNASNAVLAMASTDWAVRIDSDEMLSRELARDLRVKLKSLPEEALVLRPLRISLLDEKRTVGPIWRKDWRPNKGCHGRIFKLGCGGEYRGSDIHETYRYPGRETIPWNSPKHPKKDWHNYYIIHLWLYKDNFFRRHWTPRFEEALKEIGKTSKPMEEKWLEARSAFLEHRGWTEKKIPSGLSWVNIHWPEIGDGWLSEFVGGNNK